MTSKLGVFFFLVILVVGFAEVEDGDFSYHRWRVYALLMAVIVAVWRALSGNRG